MRGRWLLPLVIATTLPACGEPTAAAPVSPVTAPGRTVDLAETTRVTFPADPTRRGAHLLVDGSGVVVASASYEEPPNARRPKLVRMYLAAVAMRFDRAAFPTLADGDRDRFAAALRDGFVPFGAVTSLEARDVDGFPGYQLTLDGSARSPGRRRSRMRTVVRVLVGRSSLSLFAVRFDRSNLLDEDESLQALDALLTSSSVADRAPLAGAGGGENPALSPAAVQALLFN